MRRQMGAIWLARSPFDGPETSHPVDYRAKCDTEIAYLAVVLRLLRAREQARSQ